MNRNKNKDTGIFLMHDSPSGSRSTLATGSASCVPSVSMVVSPAFKIGFASEVPSFAQLEALDSEKCMKAVKKAVRAAMASTNFASHALKDAIMTSFSLGNTQ